MALGSACGDSDSGQPEQSGELRLEPVSFAGDQPFTPPAGGDREGVQPQVEAGGTVAGDTPGLYGGEMDASACDPAALTSHLEEDQDLAAAWAGVRGIAPDGIGEYLSGLTPVVLLADTAVTNHGYADGAAVSIPAVFQAGTAVLVDERGTPVVKCYCGNPLTGLTAPPEVTFVGTQWAHFSSQTVTQIDASVTVVQEFTLVQPDTGEVFARPHGTDGDADRPGPAAAPGTPSPTGTPSPGPTGTASPGPTGTASPGSPGPRGTAPGTSPSPLEPARAAWVVGGCYLDAQGQPHGVLRVRNEDTVAHTYQVTVEFSGPAGGTQATVSVQADPDETVERQVPEGGGGAAVELISCAVTEITDETGAHPAEGSSLDPPPDPPVEPAPQLETESPPTTGSPTPAPTPS